MQSAEPVTDLDLSGYIDGQLDDWDAARVETWLARHPEEAARVMLDIRLQRELRLALSPSLPPGGDATARRLTRTLSRRLNRDALLQRSLRFTPFAALAGLVMLLFSGLLPLPVGKVLASVRPPEFVTAAFAARDAINIRLPMRSMPEDPFIDPEELRAATGILLPAFPAAWQVIDAQVFPSPQGPGVEILFETPDLGRVHHFAVRPGDFALSSPRGMMSGPSPVSWFQSGETAHVLIASHGSPSELEATAQRLSNSLY